VVLGLCALAAAYPAWRLVTLPISVVVDFGPLGPETLVRRVRVLRGASAVDALRRVSDVTQSYVCCDPNDVESVGGFACDPENEGWWLYEVNGEYGPVSAHRFILASGDQVRWYYVRRGPQRRASGPPYREAPGLPGVPVVGRISAEGPVPDLPPFRVHKNEAACGRGDKAHPCAAPRQGDALPGAFVWLSGVPRGKAWADPGLPPGLDQRACVFLPHFQVARTGSVLTLRNSDDVLHTVHAYDPSKRTVFNVAQPDRSSRHRLTLDTPGVLDLQCDAGHRWMKAHLAVVDNPYHAVSGEGGDFRLEGVPEGSYTLHAWHHWFGTSERRIRVGKAPLREDFRFDPGRFGIPTDYAGAP
jgi:plastocyanin